MKVVICAVCVLVITACAPTPTLEELEAEALRTGDWSVVEKREKQIAKQESRRPQQCGPGLVSMCEKRQGRSDCRCVGQAAMARWFARH